MYVGFDVPNSTLPDDHAYGEITIDPRDGHVLPRDQLALGSALFYPMHFSLHITWYDIGYWIVGLAAMAMLAAIVSGVVMHRKIFREFFTFRPGRSCCAARSTFTTSRASWRCRFIFYGRCRA